MNVRGGNTASTRRHRAAPHGLSGQLRAEHAAVLLLHSDEPITSIGRAVGWPDQGNFARRFKAHYGLPASTYRKRFAVRATPAT